ncbi:GntR family transcriptional regulator [Thalassobaculum sp.]|uniref:GntR family transcriptional regulator n=1 Tax=Thalassobaculum sp. TaxID=2022740 RepID=UPI0032EB1D37
MSVAEALEAGEISPFRQSNKRQAIQEALQRLIIIGRLAPGTPLVETQLAAEFGSSQAPVREALMQLQESGLVVRNGYRGTVVATTSMAEACEMVAVRMRLETTGVRRAVGRFDPSLRTRLTALIGDMENAAEREDLFALTEFDRAFHLAIFEAADLPSLEPILTRCFLHVHRAALANPARARPMLQSARRHWSIFEALDTGDAETAATALADHISNVIEGMPPVDGDTRT